MATTAARAKFRLGEGIVLILGGLGAALKAERDFELGNRTYGCMKKSSRREFLGKVGAAAVGAGLASTGLGAFAEPKTARRRVMANDKIVLGLIGCGGMGAANMRNLMGHPEVEVAAVCDVDENRMAGDIADVEKKYGKKPEVFHDYRKMLERKEINAIIVGTPDHWHALNLVHACEAGKD